MPVATLRRRLERTNAVLTLALDEEASRQTQRGAVRVLLASLDAAVDDDDLWVALSSAADQRSPDSERAWVEIQDAVATETAAVLVAAGYRPPPPAEELLAAAREACELVRAGGDEPPEVARDALRRFAADLRYGLRKLRPQLLRGRRVVTALLVATGFLGVETGDSWDAKGQYSGKEGPSVVVTVPVEQVASVAARALPALVRFPGDDDPDRPGPSYEDLAAWAVEHERRRRERRPEDPPDD